MPSSCHLRPSNFTYTTCGSSFKILLSPCQSFGSEADNFQECTNNSAVGDTRDDTQDDFFHPAYALQCIHDVFWRIWTQIILTFETQRRDWIFACNVLTQVSKKLMATSPTAADSLFFKCHRSYYRQLENAFFLRGFSWERLWSHYAQSVSFSTSSTSYPQTHGS